MMQKIFTLHSLQTSATLITTESII